MSRASVPFRLTPMEISAAARAVDAALAGKPVAFAGVERQALQRAAQQLRAEVIWHGRDAGTEA